MIATALALTATPNPGPDQDLVFREINFLIFVVLMFFLLRTPVRDFFAARSRKLRSEVDSANQAYAASLKESQEITKRIKNLDLETEALMRSFQEDGELARGRILERAHEFQTKLREDAEHIADSELKKAKEALKEVTITLTRELSEQMIARDMNDEDEERITKNYLTRLKNLQ